VAVRGPAGGRIDVSDKEAVKRSAKKLGRSQEEIFAAVDRPGGNPETVAKEVRVARRT
jgi:hypothetical protein